MDEFFIDKAVYAELQLATGPEFAAELVGTFFEEAPAILAELRSALMAGDAVRFKRAAHSIKSNATTFGALTLADLARELELKSLDTEPALDFAKLTTLDAEYARVVTALKAMRDG